MLAETVPNEEALALAPTVGWLMLLCAAFAAVIFVSYREGWRRLWLRMDDPRSLGAFRIVFGICAVCNVNGLWELFEYLFTDEGLFVTDVARGVPRGHHPQYPDSAGGFIMERLLAALERTTARVQTALTSSRICVEMMTILSCARLLISWRT